MRHIALIGIASLFAACGGQKAGNAGDTAAASQGGEAAPAAAPAPGADTTTAGGAAATPGATSDTGASRDTTRGHASSSAKNQTQVGVTNSKSGKSTLDTNVQKLEPTQGQAVTSKGDTLTKNKPPR
jgi:hypothetical protein